MEKDEGQYNKKERQRIKVSYLTDDKHGAGTSLKSSVGIRAELLTVGSAACWAASLLGLSKHTLQMYQPIRIRENAKAPNA